MPDDPVARPTPAKWYWPSAKIKRAAVTRAVRFAVNRVTERQSVI
jgi:hypothetical protein